MKVSYCCLQCYGAPLPPPNWSEKFFAFLENCNHIDIAKPSGKLCLPPTRLCSLQAGTELQPAGRGGTLPKHTPHQLARRNRTCQGWLTRLLATLSAFLASAKVPSTPPQALPSTPPRFSCHHQSFSLFPFRIPLAPLSYLASSSQSNPHVLPYQQQTLSFYFPDCDKTFRFIPDCLCFIQKLPLLEPHFFPSLFPSMPPPQDFSI